MIMNVDVRGVKYDIDDELKEFAERRLWFALGRFARRIDRVVVRLSDINGPRGGVDKKCVITAMLLPRGVVRVEGLGDDPYALIADAARRARRSVRRDLVRRRARLCA
jgi:ribosome-associated translation inhibitor RaiA